MAHMIPSLWPDYNDNSGEAGLFNKLKEQLSDEYTIIHSFNWLDNSPTGRPEGECDFLILHPRDGILAIEVKGGKKVSYDNKKRKWTSGSFVIKDPFRQSQACIHKVKKIIEERRDWQGKITFGHAVAFPGAEDIPGSLPNHAHTKKEITILRPHLNAVAERIKLIQDFHSSIHPKLARSLDPASFEKIISYLLPGFNIVSTLAGKIGQQEEVFFRLFQDQIEILDMMRNFKRLVFEGCAGSGKTILAREKARRLASEGKRVLFVCYNIPLANDIRRHIENDHAIADKVDVFHFHALCEHVAQTTGQPFQVPNSWADKNNFYRSKAPEILFDALPAFPQRYDALIVDEGQDFCVDWWPPLEELLSNPQEDYCYIFHDPRQNIFRGDAIFPLASAPIQLEKNYRNTAHINNLLNAMGPFQAKNSSQVPEGDPPVLQEVNNDSEERLAISKTLNKLIINENIPNSNILILGKSRFGDSIFAANPQIGNFTVIDSIDPGNNQQIRYSTICRHKGLESDCVIVMDIGNKNFNSTIERELLYIAFSRAKHLLYGFYRPKIFKMINFQEVLDQTAKKINPGD